MKRPTFIIGKKQIVLSCLTVMLAVAVYINYVLAQNGEEEKDVSGNLNASNVNAGNLNEELMKAEDNELYGDTKFVSENENLDNYFAQARIEKMTSRDTAVQTLQTIMGAGDISDEEAVVNALDAVELSNMIEKEATIENLIKAQGFEDCIVYLDDNSAKIVVKTEGLERGAAAAIKDIILSEASVDAENIRIFEVK
jgi:stage III sporulation protein AH